LNGIVFISIIISKYTRDKSRTIATRQTIKGGGNYLKEKRTRKRKE